MQTTWNIIIFATGSCVGGVLANTGLSLVFFLCLAFLIAELVSGALFVYRKYPDSVD